MNRRCGLILAGILIVALAVGCAAGYGKMRVVDKGGMTLETLTNNWQDYEVYYYGDGNRAIAVIFVLIMIALAALLVIRKLTGRRYVL